MKKLQLLLLFVGCLVFISGTVDLDNLFNYAKQFKPDYIYTDNIGNKQFDDKMATLGRVLFYDKNLSVNNTISCASCHEQEHAFGDPRVQSVGFDGGLTGRHAMRLVNVRFSSQMRTFWDQRAFSLDKQVLQPIQDSIEMGFSGTNGHPDINILYKKLQNIDYYNKLFKFTYGDSIITDERITKALTGFIRSIQSFDSKFDEGMAKADSLDADFHNYTAQENLGKRLFVNFRERGGAGCFECHQPAEFDAVRNMANNGIVSVIGDSTKLDFTNTRSPSLRDIVNPNGTPNSPFMHDASLKTVRDVINHYNDIPNIPGNTNLDSRLIVDEDGNTQKLNLTEEQKNALEAFLKTLTGTAIYTDEKWSDPFDENGDITIVGGELSTQEQQFKTRVSVLPNPVVTHLNIKIEKGNYEYRIFNAAGVEVLCNTFSSNQKIDASTLSKGIYILKIYNLSKNTSYQKKFIKR